MILRQRNRHVLADRFFFFERFNNLALPLDSFIAGSLVSKEDIQVLSPC